MDLEQAVAVVKAFQYIVLTNSEGLLVIEEDNGLAVEFPLAVYGVLVERRATCSELKFFDQVVQVAQDIAARQVHHNEVKLH